MNILLKSLGGIWAAIGVGNILMGNGSTIAVVINVVLFIFPGLVLCGIGVAIANKKKPAAVPVPAPTKKCPQCAETVLAEARVCRFCRHAFAAEPASRYENLSRDVVKS